MKILVIHGSPRKGNTYKLTHMVMDRMKSFGQVDFDELFLKDAKLDFCLSCHSCFLNGEHTCPHNSIVSDIVARMMSADGFIITSPVYSFHLSAMLKNLIDHLAYIVHRPRFMGKKALVISDTLGSSEKEITKFVSFVLRRWGIDSVQSLAVKNMDLHLKATVSLESKVAKVSRKFYDDLLGDKRYSPSLKDVFYFSLFKAANSSAFPDDSVDRRYWREKGLADRDYYYGPLSNPFKKLLSSIFYGTLKGFFSSIAKKSSKKAA